MANTYPDPSFSSRAVTMMLIRRWKVLILTSLGVAVTLLVVLLAGGRSVSESIRTDVLECQKRDPQPDLEVIDIEEGQITLRVTPLANDKGDWNSDGIYGLESLVGYDQVGAIINSSDQQVVRDLVRLTGTTGAGDLVRLDEYAFPGDPETAFGIRFEHVQYSYPYHLPIGHLHTPGSSGLLRHSTPASCR